MKMASLFCHPRPRNCISRRVCSAPRHGKNWRHARQFYDQPLDAFQFHGTALTIDDDNERQLLNGEAYLVQSVPLGGRGWDIVQISRTREARTFALNGSGAIGFAAGF